VTMLDKKETAAVINRHMVITEALQEQWPTFPVQIIFFGHQETTSVILFHI
jgi:hypothetical protein